MKQHKEELHKKYVVKIENDMEKLKGRGKTQEEGDDHNKLIKLHEQLLRAKRIKTKGDKFASIHDRLDKEDMELQEKHTDNLIQHIGDKNSVAVGGILKILAHTMKERGKLARSRVLLKSDELVDIITQTIEQKMQMDGLGGTIAIQGIIEVVSFMMDIPPIAMIPGAALVGFAVQSAGNAAISVFAAVGSTSLTKMAEDTLIPIIEKFAHIFQAMAGSFSCCHKDSREPKVSLTSSEKSTLTKTLEELKKALSKMSELDAQSESKFDAFPEIKTALSNASEALEKLKFTAGGGIPFTHCRKRTRRKRTRRKRTRRKRTRRKRT
mgnify:CR=1 FL=1